METIVQTIKRAATEVLDHEPLRHRPISGTVGRLSTPLSAAVLGSLDPLRLEQMPKERVNEIAEEIGHDKLTNKGGLPLQIQLGSSRPLTNIGRSLTNPHTGVIGKIIGALGSPVVDAYGALARADMYNPGAHTVTSYTPNEAVLRHELGHAADYGKRDYPTLYSMLRGVPVGAPYQEYVASREALKGYDKEDKAGVGAANRILGGGLGSYVGSSLSKRLYGHSLKSQLAGAILGAITGQGIGALAKPFGRGTNREKQSAVGTALKAIAAPAGKATPLLTRLSNSIPSLRSPSVVLPTGLGVLGGGISGSKDPNSSTLGGALKGGLTGLALGVAGSKGRDYAQRVAARKGQEGMQMLNELRQKFPKGFAGTNTNAYQAAKGFSRLQQIAIDKQMAGGAGVISELLPTAAGLSYVADSAIKPNA